MPVRRLPLDHIERLGRLLTLPDEAIVPTADARLIAGGVSSSTWERKKRAGKTPRVYPINSNTDGFRVGEIKAMHAARAEAGSTTEVETQAT